jgi:hypothetical protein
MGGEKRAPVDPVTAAKYARRLKRLREAEWKAKGFPPLSQPLAMMRPPR